MAKQDSEVAERLALWLMLRAPSAHLALSVVSPSAQRYTITLPSWPTSRLNSSKSNVTNYREMHTYTQHHHQLFLSSSSAAPLLQMIQLPHGHAPWWNATVPATASQCYCGCVTRPVCVAELGSAWLSVSQMTTSWPPSSSRAAACSQFHDVHAADPINNHAQNSANYTSHDTVKTMYWLVFSCDNVWEMMTFCKIHTHTQPFYCSSGICPGPPGWAGTRKVKPRRLKPIWIYWSKR